MSKPVGQITADEARALVREKRPAVPRDAEILAVRHYGLAAQRIHDAALNGETELHYLFADIPAASRMLVIRRLQSDGFEVHDDSYGGVVFWPLGRGEP